MASVHYKLSIIKRSAGRSSVAAAAYRAAEKIIDRRTGLEHDFTRKNGVVHTEILLPVHAPQNFMQREVLWNAVEQVERQKNAQLARHLEVGLPIELDRAAQITLIREHVQQHYVDHGMCADICVHDKGDGNPHAHVMFTMRPLEPDGSWGAKSKKEYMLDRSGQRILLDSGEWKSKKVSATGWDEQSNAELWRDNWGREVNRAYERHGIEQAIDMRSYQRQGVILEPTQHMGPELTNLERKGVVSGRGTANREKLERNRAIRAYDQERSNQEHVPEHTPTFDEWRRSKAPQKEQSLELERGR